MKTKLHGERRERLIQSLVNQSLADQILELAENENRSVSMMAALLISEAMDARRESLSGDNA